MYLHHLHLTPQEAKASAERARKALVKERDAALKRKAKLELDEKEAAGKLEAGEALGWRVAGREGGRHLWMLR